MSFALKAALALDQQRIEAALLELNGEREASDAAAGNEDAFAVYAGRLVSRRLNLRGVRRRFAWRDVAARPPPPAAWRRTGSVRRHGSI
jgi:hypothetical protein